MSRRTRQSGTITAWNSDRGFGFVARPEEPDLFVHIKAFPRGTAEPVPGETITFEVESGPDGKFRAARAMPSGIAFVPPLRPTSPAIGLLAIVAFIAIYLLVTWFWTQIPLWVPVLYLGMSVIAYIAYGIDKSAARLRQRRIAETTLIMLGLLGGWPGAILGQQVFRHKTAKRSFRAVFWATVLINVFVFVTLNTPGVRLVVLDVLGG